MVFVRSENDLSRQDDPFFAGAYQLEQIIERSAYSVLGLGKKCETGLPVLLRLWFTAHVTTPEAQAHIQAEVAAFQQVQHPHLLPLLEVCTSPQGVFLVSVPAALGSLQERLQHQMRPPLSFEGALQLIWQVGQGLSALHQQGLVHGNLTPQAVLFSEPEHARLGDFWVHSILESIEHYQPTLDEGVPRCWYMAPEQFQGEYSTQSDQYALGCLAYLLLTGQVPFAGSARATLLQKHQRDQPPALQEYNPGIPWQVEAALFKALAKHPSERYDTVQAFLEALVAAQSIALAERGTLTHAFGTVLAGTPLASQEEVIQPHPFEAVGEGPAVAARTGEEAGVPAEEPVTAATWTRTRRSGATPAVLAKGEGPAADKPGEEAFALPEEPVTAASWTRTRGSGVSPAVPAKPAGRRGPARRSLSPRGRFVLLALAVLGLVIGGVAGRGLLFSGGQIPQQRSMRTTQASMQATATASSRRASSPSASPASSSSPSSTATPVSSPSGGGLAAVVPLLECVTPAGGSLVAKFGYRNPNALTVTIPLGRENSISPSNLDGSQPTSFAPGSQHAVFQLRFSRRQSVTWSLEGSTAMASSSSPRC